MARIPDATYLGERRVGDGRAPIVIDRSAEIANEGLSRTAESLNNAVQRYAAHDDAFNYARAKSQLQSADISMRSTLAEDQDWATQEQRYSDGMKGAREEASKLIRGARSRALFDTDANVDIQRGTEQVRGQARQIEGQWGRSQLDDAMQKNRTAALEAKDVPTRDALIQSTQDLIAGSLVKRYITPEQAVNVRQAFTASYGEGFVEVQPSQAEQLKLLKNPKGTPADFIAPDKRAEMARKLEDHMRVESDRREAGGERALNQADRQIASGIPMTPAMLADWTAKTRGTSSEKEFKGIVDSERQVQETLRMPIADQIRMVQEKRAALDTKGGTVTDGLNVNRLEQAVKQNIALIQNAPLLYGEQRHGDQNQQIDVTSVVDPQAQVGTAAVLQERANRIHGLQKTVGMQVPMKPLLPQEAGDLIATLDKASPQQASAIFAGLRTASGSAEVFKGAMSQIAPDAPVKSFAGLLASDQRDLVTGSKWFVPDPFVKSTDVAATLLRGDRLLNPAKSDKGEDGKPKTARLLLPEEAQLELQQKFADEVGNTFAGRSELADRAYQAVQAYYVGRADSQGKLAADSKTVDSNLVRESVKATLGNIVNYNGNGKVLPPWGMTAHDFEDRVERKFTDQAKAAGLPDSITPSLGNFGLVNTDQEGRYGIKLGEKLLLDGRGVPVTLDISRPDQHEKSGIINRTLQ